MNILLIDPKRKKYSHNSALHLGLWKFLQKKHNIIRVSGHEYSGFKTNIIKSYFEFLSLRKEGYERIIKKYKIDAIITYNSHNIIPEQHSILINEMSDIDVPKFYVCGDFFRDGIDKETLKGLMLGNFSKVFFRQKRSIWPGMEGLNPGWLPYSVDKSRYLKLSHENINKKIPKVGFVGSGKCVLPSEAERREYSKKQVETIIKNADFRNKLYKNRIEAISFLDRRGLMSQTPLGDLTVRNRQREKLFGNSYIKFLTSHLFGITCGGTCNFLVSKYFEIPAARSILVCADADGLEMFPGDMYIKYNIKNLDKLYADICEVMADRERAAYMIDGLSKYIYKNHSHEVRGDEVAKELQRFL